MITPFAMPREAASITYSTLSKPPSASLLFAADDDVYLRGHVRGAVAGA